MSIGGIVGASKETADNNQLNTTYAESLNGWILISPRILIGLVGTVSCYAWLFIMLGTSTYIPLSNLLGAEALAIHVCFLVAFAVALTLCWLAAEFLNRHRVFHFAFASIFSIVGCFGFLGNDLSLLFYVGFAALSGLGCGLLYVLYGEYICLFFREELKPYILGIFAAATLFCAGILFTGPETSFVFSIVFPILAIGAYASQMIMFHLTKQTVVSAKTSDSRSQVKWRSYLATATAGMALGFALSCILSSQTIHSWVYIFLAIGLFGTCLVLFVDSIRKNLIDEVVTMRGFLPYSAVVVFPMLFVPNEMRLVLAVLLLCGAVFPTTCSLSAICQHIVLCKLSPIRAFSLGRVINVLGILTGLLLGLLGFSMSSVSLFGEMITSVSVIAFMILVIFSASFVMTENNYPDQDRFREVVNQDESNSLIAEPGVPLYPPASKAGLPSTNEHIEKTNRPALFYAKCDAVAAKYDLSNRQREVLLMLAKGRNADYITKKLVISSHTAKAHIYNIYQKTGVHSRQELMDLVEGADAEE